VDGSGFDQSIAEQVVAEIRESGGTAVACTESVATMSGGEQIVQTAIDNFGKLDIVVTCAGILRDRMIFNMTEQEWDDVIAVHLKGTFTVVKHACILFRQQRSGRIITFSSQSGLVGNSGQANYGAAKSGIAGFTKVLAKDMGRYGVTANSIAPRATTRMIGAIPDSAAEIRARGGVSSLSDDEELKDLDPEGIAPFVCYLASDYASNVNGQTFLVYGNTVSLMSQPRPENSIFTPQGRWSMDELAIQAREYLTKGIYNPAPARE
jgi:NAD(P)-dependent dehydrogenase (short-subunit alcohol dehydrogenase family)